MSSNVYRGASSNFVESPTSRLSKRMTWKPCAAICSQNSSCHEIIWLPNPRTSSTASSVGEPKSSKKISMPFAAATDIRAMLRNVVVSGQVVDVRWCRDGMARVRGVGGGGHHDGGLWPVALALGGRSDGGADSASDGVHNGNGCRGVARRGRERGAGRPGHAVASPLR